jgi:hypothetical protein
LERTVERKNLKSLSGDEIMMADVFMKKTSENILQNLLLTRKQEPYSPGALVLKPIRPLQKQDLT